MAVYVFVVCMYVSVWCGGAPLSLSLWIVAGMVVVGHDSRAGGESLGPDCNCEDAEGLGEAITGKPTAISEHILTYPVLSTIMLHSRLH
jgi:hypothetical protein